MPQQADITSLAEFQQLLIGTWENDRELSFDGKPLSFNVMPLPQDADQPGRPPEPGASEFGGFILKNFSFVETIRFNGTSSKGDPASLQDRGAVAVAAAAPNRGGTYTQSAHAIFYEQQIRFAEGPDQGQIIHVENGSWIHLGSQAQKIGPYTDGPAIPGGQVIEQPPQLTIAKQISVPHGNSVLALGSIDVNDRNRFDQDLTGISANTVISGSPDIPDAPIPHPQPTNITTTPFYDPFATVLTGAGDFENPDANLTRNPNYPLQRAVEIIKPQAFIHWNVTTRPVFGGTGVVTNIPFEQRRSDVTEYSADYWLLSKDPNAKNSRNFEYLMYTQVILLKIRVSTDGGKTTSEYTFPHITSNTVKKLAGDPTQARSESPTPLE
ncbi:MAG: heme-binding protein [Streptosporangiales bacterium]|nr:heme-binding protein [Streptosporangiales bacterium]